MIRIKRGLLSVNQRIIANIMKLHIDNQAIMPNQ